jgi:hypothetical protein
MNSAESIVFGYPVQLDESVPIGAVRMHEATWQTLFSDVNHAKEDLRIRTKTALDNQRKGHVGYIEELEARVIELELQLGFKTEHPAA